MLDSLSINCEGVLLPLVNKLLWAYGRAEKSKGRIPSRNGGEKKVESERCPVAAEGDRDQNLTW